jgi:hypothetical protein
VIAQKHVARLGCPHYQSTSRTMQDKNNFTEGAKLGLRDVLVKLLKYKYKYHVARPWINTFRHLQPPSGYLVTT